MSQEFTPPAVDTLKDFEFLSEGIDFVTWKAFSSELAKNVEVISAKPGANPVKCSHIAYIYSLFLKMNHPSLATVYEVGKAGDTPFVIQEHPTGKSLAEVIASNGPLTDKDTVSLALQISEALAYATSQAEIVIRNLKPQNIYIDDSGVAKIFDFRYSIIARDPEHGPSVDGDSIVGTPSFISPEQAEGSPFITPRADMYALGTVLYYLLIHRTPFDGMDSMGILESQRSAQIANPREFNSHISPEITALITRLMVKNPDMRYSSWGDVVAEIKRIGKGGKCSRLQPGAVSTIAPIPGESQFADSAPDLFPGQNDARRNSAAQGARPEPVNPYAAPKKECGSGGFKFTLWLILMLWFTFLVNCRMKNPMHLPPAFAPELSIPVLDTLTEMLAGTKKQDAKPVLSDLAPTSQAPKPAAAPAPRAPAAQANTQAAPAAPAAQAQPATVQAPKPAEREITQGEMAKILERLRTADIRGAETAARAFASTPKGKEIYEFLAKTGDIDKTLGDVIIARRGRQITIRFKGKNREVVPEKIVNGDLTVTGTRSDGEKFDLTLKLSQFPDDEKLRLISQYAENEFHHITAAALALKLGDTDSFRRHCPHTGPLAPVFSIEN